MDEAMAYVNVRRLFQLHGIPQAVPSRMDMILYRAAYTDGLEKAAKMAEANYKRLHPEHSQDYYSGYAGAGYDIAKDIRQHAKEMGHE